MKKAVIIAMGMLSAYGGWSQLPTETIKETTSFPKNEMGIFTHVQMGASSQNTPVLLGLQYKRWVKPNVGLRFMAGISPFSEGYKPLVLGSVDTNTINVQYRNAQANMFFVGGGVEIQRHFYKKVHLFASLDIYGGYGTGELQTMETEVTVKNGRWEDIGPIPFDQYKMEEYSRGFVQLVPSIGGKFVFSKFSFGTQLSFATAGLHYEKVENQPSYSLPYFEQMSSYSVGLFAHYRF